MTPRSKSQQRRMEVQMVAPEVAEFRGHTFDTTISPLLDLIAENKRLKADLRRARKAIRYALGLVRNDGRGMDTHLRAALKPAKKVRT